MWKTGTADGSVSRSLTVAARIRIVTRVGVVTRVGAVLIAAVAYGQTQQPVGEVAQKDEPAIFKARVNLVPVPVVVRDRKGQAIGTLTKEDFQLSDRGKPQYIARFSVEKAGTRVIKPIEIEAAD